MPLKTRRIIFLVITLIVVISLATYICIINTSPDETSSPNYVEKKDVQPTENNSKSGNDYLTENGCNYDMSNNLYTLCTEGLLVKIKAEKRNNFDKLQKLMDSRPDNVLLSDKNIDKQFHDWYNKSENFNHLRCVANDYWTIAGSAYRQNINICEIIETQRDVQLLDENFEGFKNWIDTMDIK